MVRGESRAFTLYPEAGGDLTGYSARFELTQDGNTEPILNGDIDIVDNSIPVIVQTRELRSGIRYNLDVHIEAADGFTQIHRDVFTLK